MNRTPISACLGFGLLCGVATMAAAQGGAGHQPSRREVREDHSKLPYELHITPTTMQPDSTSIETGADHWSARGFDLKTLFAQIYDVDARLIDYGNDGAADTRYDVTLDLPREVDADVMQNLLGDALARKFKLSIKAEDRRMDVYVLTAPNGPGPALHRHAVEVKSGGLAKLMAFDSGNGAGPDFEDVGQITFTGKDCTGGVASAGISVSGGTMSEFRRTLEPDLDRVLLDETHLDGSYDFQVASYANEVELFKRLHDLGLVVTPAQRKVTVLAVRSTAVQNLQAKL